MKKWILALAVLSLTACNSGGSSGDSDGLTGRVYIECADLINEGDASDCEPIKTASFFPKAYAATTIIEAGIIQRGEQITATITVNNDTPNTFLGYWDMLFSAGCNGAETWHIVTPTATPAIPPGESWYTTVGGACGDMPLGDRTLTATLYGADPAEVLDVVEVKFTLVE